VVVDHENPVRLCFYGVHQNLVWRGGGRAAMDKFCA